LLPILLLTLLSVTPDSLPPDGPYLFEEDGAWVARWVDTDKRERGEIAFTPEHYERLPEFPSFDPRLVDLSRNFGELRRTEFEGVSRIAALSDIHGQYDTAVRLMSQNGVIDGAGNWDFGDGHLVVVGDIFDRGDQVTELLWLIHNLQVQAREAGGRVHFLLGNHETMTLEGDERYLNQKYRVTSGTTGKFYRELYGPDTYLGRWLRQLPLAITINNTAFVHGGFSRQMARHVGSIDRINKLYRTHLIDAEDMDEATEETRMSLLHGRLGPLWYRGYFQREEFSNRDLSYVLRRLDVDRIIVGHTSFTAIQSYFDDRVIAVDSSIKFGGKGELLLIEDEQLSRGTIHGRRIPLTPNSR
jgi:hypothetical protein